MTEDFSAAADFVTGAIVASAVEPSPGAVGGSGAAHCLNCQSPLSGHHCHSCGQKAKVHRTLGAFWHDIVHSVLHFDGKIWRTLPLLAWRPGDLTRRYVHGERARFVSPIALFLFTVFFTFAVFKSVLPAPEFGKDEPVSVAKAQQERAKDRADLLSDLKDLEADRKEAVRDGEGTSWIDEQTARTQSTLNKLDAEAGSALQKKALAERKIDILTRKSETAIARLEVQRAKALRDRTSTTAIDAQLADERIGLEIGRTAATAMGKTDGEAGKLKINLFGIDFLRKAAEHAAENPQLLLYKIQSNAYKYSWALVPISTPFLWLVFFWRRDLKMFDHAVFVTYSLCFMMMLGALVVAVATSAEEDGLIFGLAMGSIAVVPPVHMYRQLKQAYNTTRFGAVWRTFLLCIFASVALLLFASLIISLGVTG